MGGRTAFRRRRRVVFRGLARAAAALSHSPFPALRADLPHKGGGVGVRGVRPPVAVDRRARLPAPEMLDAVGMLVGADRHVRQRHVGDGQERVLKRLLQPLRLFLGSLQPLPGRGDLGDQRGGPRLVLLRPGPADLLGGSIAALLNGLRLGDGGTPRLVERDQPGYERRPLLLRRLGGDHIRPRRLRQAAQRRLVGQPVAVAIGRTQGVGVITDPIDVEHGNRQFPEGRSAAAS